MNDKRKDADGIFDRSLIIVIALIFLITVLIDNYQNFLYSISLVIAAYAAFLLNRNLKEFKLGFRVVALIFTFLAGLMIAVPLYSLSGVPPIVIAGAISFYLFAMIYIWKWILTIVGASS